MPVMDEEPQAAVIADVATAPDPDGDGIPNPVVLEEGVGRINEIYAVVPLVMADGSIQLQVAKGRRVCLLRVPLARRRPVDRREVAGDAGRGRAPPLPEWTSSFFTPETEFAALQDTIYQFQRSLTWGYWGLGEFSPIYPASPEVQAQFQVEFDALGAEQQFAGHQWLNASYRSFDLQAEDLAVVTVRETWEDWLYTFAENPGDAEPLGDPVGHRGPYTLDVTYTLRNVDGQWQIANAVYASEAPAWATP
jgi:hypothetical protein